MKELYEKQADGSYVKSDIEFVKLKDPKNGDEVEVPKYLEPFIGHVASVNRKDERKKAEEYASDLKEQFETLQKEHDDLRKRAKASSGDEKIENINKEHEKIVGLLNKQIDSLNAEKEAAKSKFESYYIRNNIYSELSKSDYVLHNIEDTVDTILTKGKPKLSERHDMATGNGTGEFDITISLGDKETSLDSGIKEWLGQKENFFRIKNTLSPGSGASGRYFQGGNRTIKESEFKSLPPKERAAFMANGGSYKPD